MSKRPMVFGWVALAWLLAMPLTARSQEDVPPVEFTGPLSHIPHEHDEGFVVGCGSVQFKWIPIYLTSEYHLAVFAGANSDGPLGRIVGDFFLGATPVGGFCAGLDGKAPSFPAAPVFR